MSSYVDVEQLKGGEVIEQEGFLWETGYGHTNFAVVTSDMTASGWVRIGPAKMRCEVPADFNAVALKVDAIDATIETLKDEYHKRLADLNEQKQNLLAIGYAAPSTTEEGKSHDQF